MGVVLGKPFRPKASKPLRRWPTPAELRRFLKRVTLGKEIPTGQTEPCWLWRGHKDDKGYGQFWFDGKAEWAHRFSFQALRRKKLIRGMEADHVCLNTSCVNPYHLSETTKLNNVLEGHSRRRREPGEDDEAPMPAGSLEDAPF